MILKRLIFCLLLVGFCTKVSAQRFLMDMVDTTTAMGRSMFSIYQKYGSLNFSGYMQPQFQWAETRGADAYGGGNFAENSNNRFMLRRGRIRVDYVYYNERNLPSTHFVFQIDGTERGVFIRDVWGRFFENKWQLFSVTTGMFARPFGYELNLSSSQRETPERGRMSQILMNTERDMGAMLTFSPRKENASLQWLKIDAGVFNGQGMTGPRDYDSYKDIIGRVTLQPTKVKPLGIIVSAGASVLYGGIESQSPILYEIEKAGSGYRFDGDSSASNINYVSPRHYYGADIQVKIPNKKGFTELRAEYITGLQSSTATTTRTPGTYPEAKGVDLPLYVRNFDGAYFYFLQHLGSEKHQAVVKYDWYDPNKKISGTEVDAANGFTEADVKFNTLGIGYVYYANPHLKAVFYYDWVMNESTAITGYTQDRPDNIFTLRLQYSF